MVKKKTAKKVDGTTAVLEKIAAMPEPYRAIGQRLHSLILESCPELKPRVWYGMPGYAKDGPVLCFFRVDEDLMTFGLTEKVTFQREQEEPHQLMPAAWFFKALDKPTEAKLAEIIRRVIA